MNKTIFHHRENEFAQILKKCKTNPSKFIFDSKLYLDGIRESITEVEHGTKAKSRVLDLGCGTGFTSFLLNKVGLEVEGADVDINNPEKIDEFKRIKGLQMDIWEKLKNNNLKFRYYDGVKLPFKENNFDAVVAHAVIEHIPPKNYLKVIREINRVLKPNGKFYIFRTPRRQSYAEHLAKFLGMGSHEILMDENEVMNQLEDNGFTVLSAKRTDMIIEYIPGLLPVLNLLSPILLILDSILLMTPLSFFAHHMQIISLKTSK